MAQPKVTVILPCYNHEKYLGERINSILAQTLPVSQIIFLDDASTDGSAALAESLLRNTSIETVYHSNKANSGSPFAQWNKGVLLAKHEYIWIAETDDSCDKHLLERLLRLITLENVAIAFSQSAFIDQHSKYIGSAISYMNTIWNGAFEEDFIMRGSSFIANYLSPQNSVLNASAVIFRRDAFLRAGMANGSMRFCGDWDCWIRICKFGDIAYLANTLNHFRCHESSTRAESTTPQSAAEFLSCRLSAYFNSNATLENRKNRLCKRNAQLTAMALIKALATCGPSHFTYPIYTIDWQHHSQTRDAYARIRDAPVLTRHAWAYVVFLSLVGYLHEKAKSLMARRLR